MPLSGSRSSNVCKKAARPIRKADVGCIALGRRCGRNGSSSVEHSAGSSADHSKRGHEGRRHRASASSNAIRSGRGRERSAGATTRAALAHELRKPARPHSPGANRRGRMTARKNRQANQDLARVALQKRLACHESGEERRIHRNTLLENAEAGRYGAEIRRAALSEPSLKELADELEQREANGDLRLTRLGGAPNLDGLTKVFPPSAPRSQGRSA